jgi:hypothetical protein
MVMRCECRPLHEKDEGEKWRGPSRMRFFLIVFFASFAYYALPGYLLPILTFFSWACWVWPHSITAQQVGSGYHGLGLGAFTLDWAGISAYHGSPLVAPWASIANTAAGFVMFIYVIVPLCYWRFNTFDARKFPIFSNQLFTGTGQKYDTTKVLTKDFDLNVAAYESYGKLYLSPLFAISIGSGFLRFTATIVHVLLFHGAYVIIQCLLRVDELISRDSSNDVFVFPDVGQRHVEAEQVGDERGEARRAREADAEVQAGAAVVVPCAPAGQRGGVPAHVLRLEGGGAAAVVGDALRLRARLHRHAPHRRHPGHHEPGMPLTVPYPFCLASIIHVTVVSLCF